MNWKFHNYELTSLQKYCIHSYSFVWKCIVKFSYHYKRKPYEYHVWYLLWTGYSMANHVWNTLLRLNCRTNRIFCLKLPNCLIKCLAMMICYFIKLIQIKLFSIWFSISAMLRFSMIVIQRLCTWDKQ